MVIKLTRIRGENIGWDAKNSHKTLFVDEKYVRCVIAKIFGSVPMATAVATIE